MLKLIRNTLECLTVPLLSLLMVGLVLLSSMPITYAATYPSQEAIETALEQFVGETQQTLAENMQETRMALRNLPENLETAVADLDTKRRQAVLSSLEESQKELEETAKSYKKYAKQAEKVEKDMLRSAKQTRGEMQANAQQKVQDAKQSFELTSDALDILADDLKKAISDTSTFSQVRFQQHKQALQDALDTSDKALKTLFGA